MCSCKTEGFIGISFVTFCLYVLVIITLVFQLNLVSLNTVTQYANHVSYSRATQIFQKPGSHLKMLGARRVTWSRFHTEDVQILGATIQNVVAWRLWCIWICAPLRCSVRQDIIYCWMYMGKSYNGWNWVLANLKTFTLISSDITLVWVWI